MKTCTLCGEQKPVESFGFKTPGKREARCKPCRASRSREWYSQNSERQRAVQKDYRQRNKPYMAERNRAFREANPDLIRLNNRRWYERNTEKHRANGRRWAQNNPAKVKQMARAARHGRRLGPEALEYASLIINDPCVYCGEKGGTVDHIDPIARGGSNEWNNLAGACRKCNASKCASPLIEFLARKSDCSIIQL